MSLVSEFVGDALSAGAVLAREDGLEGLATTLDSLDFAADEFGTFADDHPVEAAVGVLMAVAAVALAGPYILGVSGALADQFLMVGAGNLIGTDAVLVTSNVIVANAASWTVSHTYNSLFQDAIDVATKLGFEFSPEGQSFTIAPPSDLDSLWTNISVSLGQAVENYQDGSSQVTLLNADQSHTTMTYTGPNGTGFLVSKDVENNDGTSTITIYKPDGSFTETVYSGPNGTGSPMKSDAEYSDGTSITAVTDIHDNSIEITVKEYFGGTEHSVSFEIYPGNFELPAARTSPYIPLSLSVANVTYAEGDGSATIMFGNLSNEGISVDLDDASGTISFSNNYSDAKNTNYDASTGIVTYKYPVNIFGSLNANKNEGLIVNLTTIQQTYATAIGKIDVSGQQTYPVGGDFITLYDFGVLHVGDGPAIISATLSNSNVNLGDVDGDSLIVNLNSTHGAFSSVGTQYEVEGGDQRTFTITLDTSQAVGDVSFSLSQAGMSHDPDLPDITVGVAGGVVSATVNTYAKPIFVDDPLMEGDISYNISQSGDGWTINLGDIQQSEDGEFIAIGVSNANVGNTDNLAGSFDLSGSGFTINDADPFGNGTTIYAVIDGTSLGQHTETVVLHPISAYGWDSYYHSLSGKSFSAALPDQTLTITDNVVACFAAGTRIATPAGEVAVEDLAIGQEVITGTGVSRPIKWIGRRYTNITAHHRPETVQPIRVRRDAIDLGMPSRDLLVSPDHAIYLRGGLIPARLLVNGTSITQETRFDAVTYFHIELDEHTIILAEGLEVESYLDTGNRTMFDNAGVTIKLFPDFSTEAQVRKTCAPLIVEEKSVRLVWEQIAAQATRLGFSAPEAVVTTRDSALRLVGPEGRELYLVAEADDRLTFIMLPGQSNVRLMSRAARPSDVQPWRDDRRRLGVAVRRIVLHSEEGTIEMPVDHPLVTDGWHDVERSGTRLWRWTDGNALLPVQAGTHMVEIHLMGSTEYFAADVIDLETVAA